MSEAISRWPGTGEAPVPVARMQADGIFRHSIWDALLVGLSILQLAVIALLPIAPLIAVGVWWNSNTIAHNFIHRLFFRWRWLNVLFSCYQSALLGIPQTLWRQRHLAHHAEQTWRIQWSGQLAVEASIVLGVWWALAAWYPSFFLWAYLPGYVVGLLLCQIQGHYEHARGTISHYGRLYNALCFNDGYHIEHHARPGVHWTQLRCLGGTNGETSRFPAVLRWLEGDGRGAADRVDRTWLCALERLALQSTPLRRFMLETHRRAFERLLPNGEDIGSVGIVGGGLFPRTAIVFRRLIPNAKVVVIDGSQQSIQTSRAWLDESVEFLNDWFDARRHRGFDLLVVPLAFVGDREALYHSPPAPTVVVHDWIWRRRGKGVIVSWLLLKRLNLMTR